VVCIRYPTTEKLLEAIWYGGNTNWTVTKQNLPNGQPETLSSVFIAISPK